MAGRNDIEAGKAHILLYVKNSALTQGLKAAQQSLQGLGTRIAGIGAALTGMGATIVAPIAGAIAHFVQFGSELNDMSARTGVAASSLAELKFAAEQNGASLADVETALKKMAKAGKDVSTFDQVAAKIAAIEDPSRRAQAAIEAFGKGGTKLLPMLENLQALRKEARDAGLVPTDEAVSVADALGDAFDKVRAQGLAALFEIGAAVGRMLLPALKIVSNIAAAAINWVRQNGAIVRTVAAIGAGLVVAGTVITGIGAAIFGLGSAFGLAASALVSIAGVVAAIASPVGLIVVGLTAAVAGWLLFTESGRAAGQAVRDAVLPVIETIQTAMSGIGDALLAGNLQLAGQIAVTGLQLVFQQGVEFITGLIGGRFGAVIGDIATRLIKGDLAGAWQTVIKSMATLWASFSQGIVGVFAKAAAKITELWKSTVKGLADSILEASAKGGVFGAIASKVLGVDLKAEQEKSDRLNAQLGLGKQDLLGEAKAAAGQQIDGMAGPIEEFLAAMEQTAVDAATAAEADLKQQLAAGEEPSDAVQRLQKELAELRQQAAAAKAAAAQGAGANKPDLPNGSELKRQVSVGFSAAGLLAAGQGGGGPQERIVRGIEALNKKQDRQNDLLEKIKDKPAGIRIKR